MTKKQKIILIFVLLIGGLLRFVKLGEVPPSPDWDEASLAYNAYSVIKTGRDEYGKFLPLILRSFDDYKPAMYMYFSIPSILIFGLNVFAIRFPAAILGTLAVFVVYLLAREIYPNSKRSVPLAILTSFLFAISPWHIHFSRVAFETNVGLLFDMLVVFFFLRGLKNEKLLPLAAFCAGLNLYIYQAEKVFTPMIVIVLLLVWREEIRKISRKIILLTICVGMVLTIPLAYLSVKSPEIFMRAKGTSFASDQTSFLERSASKITEDINNKDFVGRLLDNRRVVYAITFFSNYISHFDPNWLFIRGDEARHHAPGMGILYLAELPFLLFGFYRFFWAKGMGKKKFFVFCWLLLAPIPASFSSGAPHAVRTIRMLPIPQIFTAFGVVAFVELFQKTNIFLKKIAYAIAILVFLFNFSYYLNQYFVQLNFFNSGSWQYGYKDAVDGVSDIAKNYSRIVVSNKAPMDQSYMFFLFYLKYDPSLYQKEGGTLSGGFAESHRGFDKYTFRPIDWLGENKDGSTLYVGRVDDFPGDIAAIKTVKLLNENPIIKIVSGNR